MNVLHVIPAVATQYGGPSQVVFELSRALKTLGVGVEIATTDADGANRLNVPLGKPTEQQGIVCHFFKKQASEAFKYSAPLARWLDHSAASYDLIHIHGVFSHSTLAASNAARKAGKPYVIRPMGMLDPWSLSQKKLRKRLMWHGALKTCFEHAAGIHYTTDAEQKLAEDSLHLKNGFVVPNGIEESFLTTECGESFRTELNLNPGAFVFLFLSRIHPKKGLDALLPAFVAAAREKPALDPHLVIAGDGDAAYVEALKRLIPADLQSRVHWTGWLEGAHKKAAFLECDLFVLPSAQENFGVSVLEALACGLPVLISPTVNLAPDIESSGAGWVADRSPEALKRALHTALEATDLEGRGAAGKALVAKRFTWPSVAASLLQHYERLARPTLSQKEG